MAAFEDCTNLYTIKIPKSVTSIGSGAFYNCSNLTILCYKDSYAETYAISEGIPHQYIGEDTISPTVTITDAPTEAPTEKPTNVPTKMPLSTPSAVPTKIPQIITAKDMTKTHGQKAFSLGAKTNGNGKLTYTSGNKNVVSVSASGKVTIKGCGITTITIKASETQKYKATEKKITITVKPKKAVLSTVKLSKATTAVVKWKKDTKSSGYLLQYSTNKKFKNTKSITIKSNKTTSKKITNLKKGKTYYVRICAYKVSNGKKVYGKYSSVKKIKIKK